MIYYTYYIILPSINPNIHTDVNDTDINEVISLSDNELIANPDSSYLPSIAKIKNHEWLSDVEINYALRLIKQKFPNLGGLENTLVLALGSSNERPMQDLNVYIVFDKTNHWVTAYISKKSNIWYIYDSLASEDNKTISPAIKNQLTKLSMSIRKKTKFRLKKMQKQIGCDDCGLFAIATMTDLACGIDPSQQKYVQESMRGHLAQCFQTNNMMPFPKIIEDNGVYVLI